MATPVRGEKNARQTNIHPQLRVVKRGAFVNPP
jgi:hypothetical protein